MMKKITYITAFSLLLFSCKDTVQKEYKASNVPLVTGDGQHISFSGTENLSFFKTEQVNSGDLSAEFTAPAKIAATVLTSDEGGSGQIILFENPELAGNYTQLIQHRINISQIQNINIKQRQIELERVVDLQAHGAATGQDLLNAQMALSMEQTNFANEKAALIEHESKLISGGFAPDMLRKATPGTAYLICDIPENHISKIGQGSTCRILFTSFPDETFTGKVEAVADVVDNATRMVKIRIWLNNTSNKLKAGMFANVSFGVSEGTFMSISKNSLVTVQGKNYAFIKTADRKFERREIQTGQQIGDRIIVFNGIGNGDEIAIEGVMQLKGLSFGY